MDLHHPGKDAFSRHTRRFGRGLMEHAPDETEFWIDALCYHFSVFNTTTFARQDASKVIEEMKVGDLVRFCGDHGVVGRDEGHDEPHGGAPNLWSIPISTQKEFRVKHGLLWTGIPYKIIMLRDTTTTHILMSFILDNELVLSFRDFVQDSNIAGTGIGFLLAQTTLDMARVFVRDGVLPFVTAIRTTSAPRFDLDNIFSAIITFLVTMLIIFTTIKTFNLQTKKVPIVATISNAAL